MFGGIAREVFELLPGAWSAGEPVGDGGLRPSRLPRLWPAADGDVGLWEIAGAWVTDIAVSCGAFVVLARCGGFDPCLRGDVGEVEIVVCHGAPIR